MEQEIVFGWNGSIFTEFLEFLITDHSTTSVSPSLGFADDSQNISTRIPNRTENLRPPRPQYATHASLSERS